ncbi:transcriptional regulator, MerR family [Desulfatibacillum aliphaticivorans]|uniref:Transcriptional regulator, MerR family n=1 Tax=Desulfatibacillum aliphaticivorans TaxID=218208 RepID=B8F8T7_DESAL|nr:MerR family transcriptional regulator [Desulfatibacillum aliphaticivorans]ACL01969.1 transcriptional regulator, MerR family [Desulfatibacillum aliphaticivorans]
MRLKELVDKTGVSTETIQFYLREGVLPKPRKRGKALADYGEHYVELINTIKNLQNKHFLPLSVIKNIIKKLKRLSPEEEHYFQLQSEFFSPVGHLLFQKEVVGDEEFLAVTGLAREWLSIAEEWGIISAATKDGAKVFSADDIAIGKLMVEMDRIGMGPKDGFDPEVLRHYKDRLKEMISDLNLQFTEQLFGKATADEFAEIGFSAQNLMGFYFFFIFRKLAHEDTLKRIQEKFAAQGEK